jgi:hypothetical protein
MNKVYQLNRLLESIVYVFVDKVLESLVKLGLCGGRMNVLALEKRRESSVRGKQFLPLRKFI